MEHTVTGIRDMHVPLMNLIVGVCQPEEECALCATNGVHDELLMGLNVRYIYYSKCFFSLLTLVQTFKQITLYRHMNVKSNVSVNCIMQIMFFSICFFSILDFSYTLPLT
jgi:hypothetical protein